MKWSTKRTKFPEITQNCAELNGKAVEVGVLGGGEAAWLAGIHEYGCTITITPNMRKWLRANGLPVKNSTMVIRIPERSFLRNGYDENIQDLAESAANYIGIALGGTLTADKVLEKFGEEFKGAIQDYATRLSSPANHPFTIERKGSANPLVDSGYMINKGIQYRVK